MSVRNTKSAKKAGILTVDGIPYTLARSDVFYYLKFIDYDKELFKLESKLKAKPTIVFYTEDSVNKVILDYSLANETDKKYLSTFFANMNQLSTFSLTTGSYLDASELTADLSCSLIFDEYKENKIFARVSSVTNQNSAIDVYLGDFFTGTPQLVKTGNLGTTPTTIKYALISVNPKTNKPLSSLGLIIGDVLEVVNSNSKNNQIKYQITSIETINDQEVLQIKPVTANTLPFLESLIGQTSLINLYVSGTTEQQPELSGDLGCCYINDERIENNTNYQCGIRKGSFIRGLCSVDTPEQIQLTAPIIDIERPLSSLLNSIISTAVFENVVSYTNTTTGATPFSTISVYFGNFDSIQNNRILVQRNNNYTFKQTDISNLNFIIRFSTEKDNFIPYVTNVYGLTRRNGIDSITVLQVSSNTPTLYVFLEQANETINGITNNFYYTGYSVVVTN